MRCRVKARRYTNRDSFLVRHRSGMNHGCIAWASDLLETRNPLVDGGKHREGGVRFRLIPIGHGIVIVRAVIGVAMFDGGAQRLCKSNRRIQVKAIDGRFASRAFFADNWSAVQLIEKGMSAKIPCTKEIILRTSPRNGGARFTVDEKHVVAFAPPAVLILQDRHSDPDEMPATRGVQPEVIFLAVEVRFPVDLGITIVLPIGSPAVVGLGLAELRVKVESPARQRLGVRAIVKVEIEGIHFLLAFVGSCDARMLLKWHEEKGV